MQGKALDEKGFSVHAKSKVVFVVPEGYDTFQTSMLVTHGKADLRASVVIAKKQKHLPVYKKELWSGKGGNKSVGVQTFDIEVPGEGFITLESHHFNGNIHGDGTVWLDVTVEGDYGTRKLLGSAWEYARAGYGRAHLTKDKPYNYKGKDYAESLNLHATGSAKWKLPKGTKRIKGSFAAISHGAVQPKIHYTTVALPLTGLHKEKVVELRLSNW